LVEDLACLQIDEDDMLVSHNVVLFTNTTVKESLDVIKAKLEQDLDWKVRTLLEQNNTIQLLEYILTTTYHIPRSDI